MRSTTVTSSPAEHCLTWFQVASGLASREVPRSLYWETRHEVGVRGSTPELIEKAPLDF